MPTEMLVRLEADFNQASVIEKIKKQELPLARVEELKDDGYWTFIYLTSLDLIPASKKMEKIVKIAGVESAEISLGKSYFDEFVQD